MNATSAEAMNATRLFSIFTDAAWVREQCTVELCDTACEYLLRFCEVNRGTLIRRIEKERTGLPAGLLLYRICRLLLQKWNKDKDYRFLNLLYKFETRRYLGKFPNDAVSVAFRAQLRQTLSRELGHD